MLQYVITIFLFLLFSMCNCELMKQQKNISMLR